MIIYAIVATKIHFAARELYTHAQTHRLQERESHCQKTVEVGG